MRPEIYRNNKSTEQAYLELEPRGMNQYAPRAGYYKVIRKCRVPISGRLIKGVVVYWKLNIDDEFDTDFETKIQLESFNRNQSPSSSQLPSEDLTNRIIHVRSAQIRNDGIRKFIVDWEIQPIMRATIDGLNNLLQSGEHNIIDSVLASTEGLDLDGDEIDYGVDDSQDY
ncbi:hypothetical protein CPT03_21950 [Pedobacter ginsengisoli]|uniref:Uncharacterized protein n=1 Tax=Pedobacter ginsengisoli TaxID=363852 RepID=A0A2D1UBL0_9SPHI|nr:hypothetical protein [Pedobacter ginsengisoli]ATP58941.1 hypothetical protein CPT03_21950 [Pedobacter ginsengisoli]